MRPSSATAPAERQVTRRGRGEARCRRRAGRPRAAGSVLAAARGCSTAWRRAPDAVAGQRAPCTLRRPSTALDVRAAAAPRFAAGCPPQQGSPATATRVSTDRAQSCRSSGDARALRCAWGATMNVCHTADAERCVPGAQTCFVPSLRCEPAGNQPPGLMGWSRPGFSGGCSPSLNAAWTYTSQAALDSRH